MECLCCCYAHTLTVCDGGTQYVYYDPPIYFRVSLKNAANLMAMNILCRLINIHCNQIWWPNANKTNTYGNFDDHSNEKSVNFAIHNRRKLSIFSIFFRAAAN